MVALEAEHFLLEHKIQLGKSKPQSKMASIVSP
jgi:hypothetical protein